MMTIREFKRLYRIIEVQLRYGLDDFIPQDPRSELPKKLRKSLFWIKNEYPDKPLGERLRLALQELGPSMDQVWPNDVDSA